MNAARNDDLPYHVKSSYHFSFASSSWALCVLKERIERRVLKEDDSQTNNKQHANKQTHRETSKLASNVIKVNASQKENLFYQTFCMRVAIRRLYVLCVVRSMIDDHMLFVTE